LSSVVTLGGGCFWCTEAIFKELEGVEKVESGYSGGTKANPSYEEVCRGNTGHAEVVQITFDPKKVALEQILQVFFTVHDPTMINQQGADVGAQYRSVIFYRGDEQRMIAEQVISGVNASRIWPKPIVTQLVPFTAFFPAEGYHKDYFRRNPDKAYCQIVIAPKVAKFRKQYLELLKAR
jgi:peptide-methionine (S)-S-oxide reductase